MPTKEEMRTLAEEIVRSYEGRVADIASLRDEVATQQQATQVQLRELDRAHQAMARELRADLTKGRSDLASSVASQLNEQDAAHQAMARQQRADLAKGRADLTQAEAGRKSEVNTWMNQVATAHAEARNEWQNLTATMQAKRGVPVVEGIAEEEAMVRAEVAEVTPDIAALRDQVFEYLANHPDGTRRVELEQEFGLARVQMARVIKGLVDENKVIKRELLYFAI